MSSKDVEQMRVMLRGAGWEHHRTASTNHEVWRWPATGGTIALPCSPSDHRWWENTLADAQRVSGQPLLVKQRAGHFRFVKGAGFSLTAAQGERRRRDRRIDELLDQLEPIHDRALQVLGEPPSRAALPEMQRLVRQHLGICEALERQGFDPPPFPTAQDAA